MANYRQSVLTAFQQVEDGISNLSTLSQALSTQAQAVDDARNALDIANNRYVGGVTNYLDVITAKTTLLNSQRLETQLLGQQLVSSVYLVKALGGGWDASQIQNEQVHPQPGQIVPAIVFGSGSLRAPLQLSSTLLITFSTSCRLSPACQLPIVLIYLTSRCDLHH